MCSTISPIAAPTRNPLILNTVKYGKSWPTRNNLSTQPQFATDYLSNPRADREPHSGAPCNSHICDPPPTRSRTACGTSGTSGTFGLRVDRGMVFYGRCRSFRRAYRGAGRFASVAHCDVSYSALLKMPSNTNKIAPGGDDANTNSFPSSIECAIVGRIKFCPWDTNNPPIKLLRHRFGPQITLVAFFIRRLPCL